MRKVLLIQDSLDKYSPFITYYKELLEKNEVEYDVIQWNRLGDIMNLDVKSNVYTFNKYAKLSNNIFSKVIDYLLYAHFIKKQLKKKSYSTVIVFSIQVSIFISLYLLKYYSYKYILDIRDYSPLLKVNLLKKLLAKLMNNSAINVVSSIGFLKWLPVKKNIIVSHNVNGRFLQDEVLYAPVKFEYPIKILTIGQIRDFDSNKRIIDSLGNNKLFNIQFSGMGKNLYSLMYYAKKNGINNILFTGQYEKKDEEFIVKECDMVNILLIHNINSDSAMANRFYLSVIAQKPMIVNSRCLQADIVNKYNLGLVLEDDDIIDKCINDYITAFDYEKYHIGCTKFLNQVKKDYALWNNSILDIIKQNI